MFERWTTRPERVCTPRRSPALNSFVAGYALASRDVTAATAALAC